MAERIAVIGAGAWGTTLARMLAAGGHPVTLWAHRPEAAEEMARDGENRRYLPGHPFPAGLVVTGDAAELRNPHRLYVLAVPSAHVRETLRRVAGDLGPATRRSVPRAWADGTASTYNRCGIVSSAASPVTRSPGGNGYPGR